MKITIELIMNTGTNYNATIQFNRNGGVSSVRGEEGGRGGEGRIRGKGGEEGGT